MQSNTTITGYVGEGAQAVAIGAHIAQVNHIYQHTRPQPVDDATLRAALAQLDALPTDAIPPVTPLPPGSRLDLSPNPLFVGRESELRTLARTLKGGGAIAIGQVQTAAATGWGGIGKTQLAVEFAQRYGRFFAGGVFWLSFADPAGVHAEIALCGGPGHLDLRPDYGALKLEDQLRLVLAAWQDGLPRMLIFDNCEEPALLTAYRPRTGRCRILLTSRRAAWERTLGLTLLPLETLPRAESIRLLLKFLAPNGEPTPDEPIHHSQFSVHNSQLDAIAAELGDLPLALHLAGSYLERYRHTVTPEAYLAQLRSPQILHHRSLQMGGHSPTGHEQNVARTFALSYDKLDPTDPTDALALRLLARAAHFAPNLPIPRSLLLASADQAEDDIAAADALARLAGLGLIEVEVDGAARLHRLIAFFVQGVAADDDAQDDVEAAMYSAATRLNNAGYPAALLSWQPHLRYVADLALQHSRPQATHLCNELGYHLEETGDLAGARHHYERALTIRRQVLGEGHPDTAQSLNNLGALLDSLGELAAAKPYYEQALAICRHALGEQHPHTATSLNNLGSLLQAQGELAAARSYLEQALAIRRQVLGEQHPHTAASLNNLGSLLQAQGDLAGARPYYEQALAICRHALGEQHPHTATSLHNLGYLLQAQGDLVGARPYYEQALAIRRQVLGEGHPDTATSLNNLGYLLQAQGELAEAKPYCEQALAIRRQVLGEQHPDTATSLNNLGGLLHSMGELATAKPYYERALAIRRQVLGEQHPDTATSLNNLGGLLYSLGELAAAKPYYEWALAISRHALGEGHPDTARSLNNLGYLLQAQGDLAGARPYYERALAIRRQVLGEGHPDTATSLNNLGGLLHSMGELAGAKPYYERALAISQQVLGEGHPDTALGLNNLGWLLRAQGELAAAKPYLEQALAILAARLGPDHPTTQIIRSNLTALLAALQDQQPP